MSDGSQSIAKNPLYNDANLERIVNTLCRVRGAALKLGQMISLQGSTIIIVHLNLLRKVTQGHTYWILLLYWA